MRDVHTAPGVQPIIDHFDGLPLQPKIDIANVICLPETFPDLQTAQTESDRFIARSEHPCEMFYSGLTNSYDSQHSMPAIEELDALFLDASRTSKDFTIANRSGRTGYLQAAWWRYLAFGGSNSGDEADEFSQKHSFSYWKFIEGSNLYMIEDSGRTGRYYVGKINDGAGIAIIEDRKVVARMSWNHGPEYPDVDAEKLIEFYESTRTNELFDASNCPLVELVDPDGDKPAIFLQYHPTNQTVQANNFEITNPTDSFFVRGATPVDGIEIKLYMNEISDQRQPETAYGLGAVNISPAADEYYDAQAEVKVIPSTSADPVSSRNRFLIATIDHGTRTNAFKPRVTVGLPKDSYRELCLAADRASGYVEAYIVSNGLNAFMQYYDHHAKKVVTL